MSKKIIEIDWTEKVSKLVKEMHKELCEKTESHLRDELIKMGWTPPAKPEPERICDECGGKFGDKCCHVGVSSPPLPLHARVAKALGLDMKEFPPGKWHYWRTPHRGWFPIPDYPHDIAAAIGALREYCREIHCYYRIEGFSRSGNYFCELRSYVPDEDGDYTLALEKAKTVSEAICHAIANHAEGK